MNNIYIDSCVWNILYDNNIDLSKELPNTEFKLYITKQIYDFEMPKMPDNLKNYSNIQIERSNIETFAFFGWTPHDNNIRDRVGGWDQSYWASDEQLNLIDRFEKCFGNEKKTGLYNREADASLAVMAYSSSSFILTAENLIEDPLKTAANETGNVISLCNFNPKEKSLKSFVTDFILKKR